jgi:hypothetical protein
MPKVRDILSQITDSEDDSMVEFSLSISVSKIKEILLDTQPDDDVVVCMNILPQTIPETHSEEAYLH